MVTAALCTVKFAVAKPFFSLTFIFYIHQSKIMSEWKPSHIHVENHFNRDTQFLPTHMALKMSMWGKELFCTNVSDSWVACGQWWYFNELILASVVHWPGYGIKAKVFNFVGLWAKDKKEVCSPSSNNSFLSVHRMIGQPPLYLRHMLWTSFLESGRPSFKNKSLGQSMMNSHPLGTILRARRDCFLSTSECHLHPGSLTICLSYVF